MTSATLQPTRSHSSSTHSSGVRHSKRTGIGKELACLVIFLFFNNRLRTASLCHKIRNVFDAWCDVQYAEPFFLTSGKDRLVVRSSPAQTQRGGRGGWVGKGRGWKGREKGDGEGGGGEMVVGGRRGRREGGTEGRTEGRREGGRGGGEGEEGDGEGRRGRREGGRGKGGGEGGRGRRRREGGGKLKGKGKGRGGRREEGGREKGGEEGEGEKGEEGREEGGRGVKRGSVHYVFDRRLPLCILPEDGPIFMSVLKEQLSVEGVQPSDMLWALERVVFIGCTSVRHSMDVVVACHVECVRSVLRQGESECRIQDGFPLFVTHMLDDVLELQFEGVLLLVNGTGSVDHTVNFVAFGSLGGVEDADGVFKSAVGLALAKRLATCWQHSSQGCRRLYARTKPWVNSYIIFVVSALF